SLTFTSANWDMPQYVTVTGVDDDIDDGDIAYQIISTTASADSNYNAIGTSPFSATNIDDDAVGIIISPTSGLVTSEAGLTTTFTVRLSSQPSGDVTINLSSSNTNEGSVPGSVTIVAAQWDVPVTVTVSGMDDAANDGPVSYSIITS